MKGGFQWRSHAPCRAIEEATRFMADEPYMVSFVCMHVQISMALCSSSANSKLCNTRD